MVESFQQVTVALTILAVVSYIPLGIYLPNSHRLIDNLVYRNIARRHGTEAAQRNFYHPLHRFDLAVINSDGTLLAPHGANINQAGTPLLAWHADGYWVLSLSMGNVTLGTAVWDDMVGIDSLIERLAQEHGRPTAQPPSSTADPISNTPSHTLTRAVKDLQEATGGSLEPCGGIAQLVRHQPSDKPVAVLVTFPQQMVNRKDFIVQSMEARGWNPVPLSTSPSTICLTLANPSEWPRISLAVSNPEGASSGHRRW